MKSNLSDIINLDCVEEEFVNLRIKDFGGLEPAIERQFRELDCSRILDNGMRLMQTDSFRYEYEMAIIYSLILKLDDADKQKEYIVRLESLNDSNLAFEFNNPPIPIPRNNKGKTTKPKKVKQERFPFDKEVKAEQRLKEHAKLLGGIKLNIKIK